MKFIILIIPLFLFVGCANTIVSRGGHVVLWTQANATTLEFHSGNTSLVMTGMDHAVATRAGGSFAGTVGMGLAAMSVKSIAH